MIAFILFSWMPYARVMDTTITRVRQNEYVEAAQVVGVKKIRIIFRHILPNAISPAIVLAAKRAASEQRDFFRCLFWSQKR